MTTTDQTLEQPTADPARPPRPAQSAAAARVGGGVGGYSRVHDLKCWPAPFTAVLAGFKAYEIRDNDRDYRVGDVLRLCEWSPADDTITPGHYPVRRGAYTGRECTRVVTHMTPGGEWGLPEHLCVLSLALPTLATPTPAVADALARAEEGGRLAGAATPGPWRVAHGANGGAEDWYVETARGYAAWNDRGEAERPDAEFIAWCRANVPLMREDVRALAGQLAYIESARAGWQARAEAAERLLGECRVVSNRHAMAVERVRGADEHATNDALTLRAIAGRAWEHANRPDTPADEAMVNLTGAEMEALDRAATRLIYTLSAARAPLAAAERVGEDVSVLRQWVWLTHGCVGLYGDDGEMQCSGCGLDFKRDDVGRIGSVLHARAMQRAALPARPSTPAAEGEPDA